MIYDDSIYSPFIADLPAQMIPLSKKTDTWKEQCMDALEQVGRTQYRDNLKLIENYEMVKGRFIFSHYFENEGYTDYMAQLTREFELPSYLRHYDIISQVIKTLLGEYQKRPDIFRVKNLSEDVTNEYERTKTDLIHKYVNSQIEAEVAKKMLEMGLDENKQDFASPEEQQQYQKTIDDAKQQLTPPQIQEYMNTNWFQAAELWAAHQLEFDKQTYNLPEKEIREFEDMLVSDRCFRHFYLTPTGFNQETWNPVNVFYRKSPDVEYIEDGDYVGRVFQLTVPAIIDRYGHLMTKDQIERLEDKKTKPDKRWNYAAGTEYVYDEYLMPFKGFRGHDILKKTGMTQAAGLPMLDPSLFVDGSIFNIQRGMYFVTEGYWMSQQKIGKVTYIDPNTGITTKIFVDESFVVPEDFVELNSSFSDSEDINTVVWTWVNRTWKGVKINLATSPYGEDLYLDIRPLDFEFKGDFNPYGSKLPVCGQVFSVRNSKSMSLVDLMKPYQIFYNVAMNQLYQIAEREIGNFVAMDVNLFPDVKDWGGEKSWEKWMLVAKNLGMVPVDTSPANIKGALAATSGFLPKEFNFDESVRMTSRISMAKEFEQMALRQVGFNQYRLGAYTSEATKGGIEAGQEQSYAQTESYFTGFSNYLRRCYQMDLSMAQYVQAKNKDITVMYSKSDMSRGYIKIAGTELLTANIGIRVINSQEYVRQLESLRRLAIENNTSGATMLDLAEVITANSPDQIKLKLKESQDRQQSQIDKDQQLKQQQVDQEGQIEQQKLQQEEDHFTRELQNKLDVAYVTQGSGIINSDSAPNTPPDVKDDTTANHNANKLELERQKFIAKTSTDNKKLALEQAKLQQQLVLEKQKLNIVKTMKGKKT